MIYRVQEKAQSPADGIGSPLILVFSDFGAMLENKFLIVYRNKPIAIISMG